jgi:signal transduction histidine kinase/ActR/RegA family two-component response regulator
MIHCNDFCGYPALNSTPGPFPAACPRSYSGRHVTSYRPFSRGALVRVLAKLLRWGKQSRQLRTELILSFVLLTAGLTAVTLVVVRNNAQAHAQQQIEQDTSNAAFIFEAVQRQQLVALARKADLLATVAGMRNGDATAVQEASDDPWKTDDCNLFILTDKNGSISALHSADSRFPPVTAQQLVYRAVKRGDSTGWWFNGRELYQVVVQPFYSAGGKKDTQGYVVVGREIDTAALADLARISSSDVVFRYEDSIAISTLKPILEGQLAHKLPALSGTAQLDLGNERYFASSLDLTNGGHPTVSLLFLKSYAPTAAYLERLDQLLLKIAIVTILFGGTLIYLISDTITRPLASLVQGVQALERGDHAYPLDSGGHNEMARLTRAFDDMRQALQKTASDKEQLESQLRQAQKMEALGRLAGGVAHDFNNLLTVIRGHSELLLDRIQPGEPAHNSTQQIRKTSDRAAALTRQLLAFSRMQVLLPKVLDVNELIAEMHKLLRRLVREDIEFSLRLGDSLGRVKADPGQLEQVLLNLTVNASDAMPVGGKLTIETQNVVLDHTYAHKIPQAAPGLYTLISVADTGCGMDEATKARIFEPFFTTKEPGKGTGLGLATVYGVVQQSGGFIWLESEVGQGTRFEIYLPRTDEAVDDISSDLASAIAGKLKKPRKTVLIVEDEKEVRELASEFLSSAGYGVLTAEDGLDALATVERMGKSIHLVLTDMVMPKMRGVELGQQLRRALPKVKVAYMTGYLEKNIAAEQLLGDGFFLQKPFSRETLVNLVRHALDTEQPPEREISRQQLSVV